ncbi:hypothetical protein HA402_010014 [Bradysia odoriphaga]|nr:hypothetical protein HA402_010014 [Bradysia odoriphaga]
MKNPLEGLRILDLSRVLAGPWCAQILGDLGADVVKVEVPGRGDDSRQFGACLPGTDLDGGRDSAFFLACNRNKRSIAVNFATPEGAQLIREMAQHADIVVENFKAGGLRKFGLDWASLQPLNPRLIYCSVTGFGQDGPYAPRPAYDFIMQAMSGMMSTCGQPDGSPGGGPIRTAIPTTDLVTGFNAAISVLGAIIQRGVTGRGQFIDAAMIDASVAFNVHLAQGFLFTGSTPTRHGNGNPIAAPSDVFRTADGWMVVAAGNDRQFESLCLALDREDLARNPAYARNELRIPLRNVLHNELEPRLQRHNTAHWMQVFENAQVPCAPINNINQVFEDPQVQHRQMTVEVDHASGHRVPILRSPLNMSGAQPTYRAPPRLGQHTREVLDEWIAMNPQQMQDLQNQGVIAGI